MFQVHHQLVLKLISPTARFLETAHPVDDVLRLRYPGSRPNDTAYSGANRTPIRFEVGQRSDSKRTVFLQSPHDPVQSKGNPEVGTKELVSIVRTDPFPEETPGSGMSEIGPAGLCRLGHASMTHHPPEASRKVDRHFTVRIAATRDQIPYRVRHLCIALFLEAVQDQRCLNDNRWVQVQLDLS